MFNRKYLTFIALALLIATLLLGGSSPVSAQEGGDQPASQPAQAPPTAEPTQEPTAEPTQAPPAAEPTQEPTAEPVQAPPTAEPVEEPTAEPVQAPPTAEPVEEPEGQPAEPLPAPTAEPSEELATDGGQLPLFQGTVNEEDCAAIIQDKTKTPQEDREKAAACNLQQGALNPLMVAPQEGAAIAAPIGPNLINGTPHYFSHPNYANSPLPVVEGAVIPVGNPLRDRTYASDYPVASGALAPVLVVLPQALPDGLLQSFQTQNQATPGGSPFASAGNVFHAYVLRPTANANEYTVVFDSGLLTVPPLADPGVSEVVTFGVANLAVQAGDRLAFYGQGIPVDTGTGTDTLSYPAPTPPAQDATLTLGSAEFPVYPQARTYSFSAQVLDLSGQNTVITGGMRKFVDSLPMFGTDIPIAVPDTTTYPGSDYYEIELVQYTQQMHSDLPATTLRGYRQINMGGTAAHYLGPTIVATRNRPVRILFRNSLPTGAGGNLFIPVDTTVMGAGMTPMGGMGEDNGQNPMCGTADPMMKADMVRMGHCFPENRATLHLHGGLTPWISDGTPHQWITPANEDTPYPQGVSVKNVPDMDVCNSPTDGCQTFFYSNQQSARLMFYHDHAWGITRLNVYAGEAAGYLITDSTEQALVSQGVIPSPVDLATTIPLVIQDKTFVPDDAQLLLQDETWDKDRWGGLGSLWLPHVYSPAQNPGDSSGVNQFGRWAYGPWFWPPTTNIAYPPIANPYYDPACDPDLTWCEPPLMPGVPFNSMGMEAFMDTPVVNGAAYPTVTLEPKTYRFRILSAANDRFFNLSLYKAVDANGVVCDAANPNPAAESTGVTCTEVALNPAEVAAALADPAGVFPTPLAGMEGPSWIQIATEGGFLPAPVVIPPHVTTWVTDPTVFNAGNVDQHALLLGPAERADVIVDFSQFAGQTLILYNDAPAAFPARDPRYDYYTGNPDLRDTGGAPSTLAGYGPNTRTVMQIRVSGTPSQPFNLGALQTAFRATDQGGQGVFQNGQPPIVVGQGAYNSAYGTSFQNNGPNAGLVQIFDTQFSFKTLAGGAAGPSLTMPLQPKQIQDEMGEAFDKDYGRMSGFLGLEKPGANAGVQNMILYPYVNPASENLNGIVLPPGVSITPITDANEGSQVWKITHNGVDTHPIHFHLFEVQVINRVGWDGIIRKPDPNELGWKDTVRISPLEDTIVAFRPILPKMPFGIPDSERLLNPMMPVGSTVMFNPTDANGDPIPGGISNVLTNFGWEYVWHCHILSHEEMDMMRPIAVNARNELPVAPDPVTAIGNPGSPIVLSWMDGTAVTMDSLLTWGDPRNEIGFRVERAEGNGPFAVIHTTLPNVTTFTDTSTAPGADYHYRVVAFNAAGSAESAVILVGSMALPPAAPTTLAATMQFGPQVTLTWLDNADDETNFVVERSVDGGATFGTISPAGSPGQSAGTGGTVTYVDTTVVPGGSYVYQVYAVNAVPLPSSYSNSVIVNVPIAPLAPTNPATLVQGSLTIGPRIRVTFRDNALNETGFVIQRSDNGGAFVEITTLGPRANRGSVTYFDGVVATHTYIYRIFTVNGPSPSAFVETAPVTVPAGADTPTNFAATTTLTNGGTRVRINLSWTDVANETRYVVQRATDATFTTGLVTVNRSINVTTLSQTGLLRNTTYYYRLMAQNPYGSSPWVNLVVSTTIP